MTQDQAEAALVRVGRFWDGIEGACPCLRLRLFDSVLSMQRPMKSLCLSRPLLPSPNPMGEVLEAFQAAMLDDTVGPALLDTLGPGEFIETIPRRHRLNDEVTYDGGRDSRRPMPRSAAVALGGRWCDGARPCAWRADNWQRAWSAEPHRPAVRQR